VAESGLRLRRAIVYRGEAAAEERTLPLIPPGSVLIQVYAAAWTGVEEAARTGVLAARYGVVMGHTGYGRVVAVGPGAEELSGKLVALARVPEQLPGVDADGFLSDYTVAPAGSLEELTGTPPAYTALYLEASLACDALQRLEQSDAGRVAVLGGGPGGVLAAALLAEEGYTVQLFTDKRLGGHCPATAAARGRPAGFDAYIHMLPWAYVEADGLHLLHPYSHPRLSPTPRSLRVEKLTGASGGCPRRLLRENLGRGSCLEKMLVYVDEPIPPPPLGDRGAYIYTFTQRRRRR